MKSSAGWEKKKHALLNQWPFPNVFVADANDLNLKDESHHFVEREEAVVPEAESVDNLTLAKEEGPAETKEEPSVLEEVHSTPDIIMEEDGAHFNKNKDNQPSFSASEEMPDQDMDTDTRQGLDVEPEQPSSGWEFNGYKNVTLLICQTDKWHFFFYHGSQNKCLRSQKTWGSSQVDYCTQAASFQ